MKLPKRVRNFVVIYDIFSDGKEKWFSHSERRRARIARFLLEFGIRTQKSVFELTISPSEMEKLIKRIEKVANPNRDKIYIYPIESRTLKKINRSGREIEVLKNIFI